MIKNAPSCPADFICFDQVMLKIKAVAQRIDEHRAQMPSDLKATGFRAELMVNFGHDPLVVPERIVR